jgi:UDPglucose 6-dehydrogenase
MEKKSEMTLLKKVDEVNKKQKSVLLNKILNHFNGDIKGKKFAVWGLAFKPNTDDMREAPSITIINGLLENGATVSAYDPAAMENAKFHFSNKIEYVHEQYDTLDNSDALLVLTEWNEFRNPEFDRIENKLNQKLIFDGRNVYSTKQMEELGFTYYSIGRVPVTK